MVRCEVAAEKCYKLSPNTFYFNLRSSYFIVFVFLERCAFMYFFDLVFLFLHQIELKLSV